MNRRKSEQEKASRNSTRVRWLKIALPIGAVLLAVMVAGMAYMIDTIGGMVLPDLDGIVTEQGIVMQKPQVTGSTDGNFYRVSAELSMQRLDDVMVFDLKEIVASIAMPDGETVKVTSSNGVFNSATDTLNLSDGVSIAWKSGYSMRLESVTVDLESGVIRSDDGIAIRSPLGDLDAGTFEYSEDGKTAKFKGGVRLEIK